MCWMWPHNFGELIPFFCCSETIAPTLTTLFYLLARHPNDMETIADELGSVDIEDVRAIASLPHLNGAINEAMRLLPAVPTVGTRVSPPDGMEVEGTFIPGDVKLVAPRYSIGRRKAPSSWFLGEPLVLSRVFWTWHLWLIIWFWNSPVRLGRAPRILPRAMVQPTRDDTRSTSFCTFWSRYCACSFMNCCIHVVTFPGQTSCVGKALAMIEVRLAMAAMLSRFRISFAQGSDGGRRVELGMKDQLTAKPGDLFLVFEPR